MAVLIEGTQRIEAPIDRVWAAINDPEVLRRCIPGCLELEKLSDHEMRGKIQLGIGPIKATFQGAVALENMVPPHSCTITGEGKGGIAGFAKGSADVRLSEEGEAATLLAYSVRTEVGGKIAQLGARLIVSTSKKLAGEFFTALGRTLDAEAA
ncbi:MAG: carbon monoxide dehydrogenase subunit G [Rhizobiaceae bacterium]